METAGNEAFDGETGKKGLSTPATRAGIIEKLVKGGFIEREESRSFHEGRQQLYVSFRNRSLRLP